MKIDLRDPLFPLWTRRYSLGEGEGVTRGFWVQVTSDGGYIIAGYTRSYNSDGSIDLLLIKTDSLGRVEGIEDEPPVTHPSNWQISVSIGRQVTLRYSDHLDGFQAFVFDACGRKVDEVHATESSGMITWGRGIS